MVGPLIGFALVLIAKTSYILDDDNNRVSVWEAFCTLSQLIFTMFLVYPSPSWLFTWRNCRSESKTLCWRSHSEYREARVASFQSFSYKSLHTLLPCIYTQMRICIITHPPPLPSPKGHNYIHHFASISLSSHQSIVSLCGQVFSLPQSVVQMYVGGVYKPLQGLILQEASQGNKEWDT